MAAMTLERITLIDRKPELVREWRALFDGCLASLLYRVPVVEVVHDDYFSVDADAMVSPANSFGFMDGGIDLPIRETLGRHAEDALQLLIARHWHGELPVGSAQLVPTEHARWPWLVSAPTMRLPADVSGTLNAYLAFRAALLAVEANNRSNPHDAIKTLVCCGLATATGKMSPKRCAVQMRMAYDAVINGPQEHSTLAQAMALQATQEQAMREIPEWR